MDSPRQRIVEAAGRAYVEARATLPRKSGVYDQECGRARDLAAAREALIIVKARIGTDYDPEFEIDRLISELAQEITSHG